jgi:hypothetical protein
MDFQTCYVYDPSARNNDRPVKRRRIEPLQGLQTSWPLRRSLYQRLWAKQQHRLKVDISMLIPFLILKINTEPASGNQRINHQPNLYFCRIHSSSTSPWQGFFGHHPHWSEYRITRFALLPIVYQYRPS